MPAHLIRGLICTRKEITRPDGHTARIRYCRVRPIGKFTNTKFRAIRGAESRVFVMNTVVVACTDDKRRRARRGARVRDYLSLKKNTRLNTNNNKQDLTRRQSLTVSGPMLLLLLCLSRVFMLFFFLILICPHASRSFA